MIEAILIESRIKMGKIEFYTERLIIRQLCENNLEAYFKLLNNPKAHCFKQDKIENLEEARNEIFIKKDKNDGLRIGCMSKTYQRIYRQFIWALGKRYF